MPREGGEKDAGRDERRGENKREDKTRTWVRGARGRAPAGRGSIVDTAWLTVCPNRVPPNSG